MRAENLKVGDIIINGTNVVVVGTNPIVNGNSISFYAVLKENRRDVFKVSTRESYYDINDGNIVADAIISSFTDALNYHADSEEVRNKFELAVRKRNWALDVIDIDAETDAPEPEVPAHDTIRYEVTLTVNHGDDPDEDLNESLQYMVDEEQVVEFTLNRID